jgi:RNA polymerase sigma factor (sigma-70 family)
MFLGWQQADAEDASQSALLKAHLNWARVETATDPSAYVTKILINTLRSNSRRRWRGEIAVAQVPEPTGQVAPTPDLVSEVFVAALSTLPIIQREVLALRYYLHYDVAGTATLLGISEGTVKSRTSRALDALAERPDLRHLVRASQDSTTLGGVQHSTSTQGA